MLALPHLLSSAGAVMTVRDGRPIAAHYGSAAGELAVCVRGVGLAVRADLSVVSLTGSAHARVSDRVLGLTLAPGGAALEAGSWWCRRTTAEELVVIGRRAATARLVRSLRHDVGRFANVGLTDRSEDRVVLNLVGRRTPALLRDLGAFGAAG